MGAIIFIALMVAAISVYDYLDSKDWQSATSNSRNNLIFEHRNKKYGAYNLRRDYNDSFGIIIGGVILFLALFFVLNANIRTTVVHVSLPLEDTTLLTIAAPPVEEIKTIKTPYKIVGGGGGGNEGTRSVNPVDRNPKDQAPKPTINNTRNNTPEGQSDHGHKASNNSSTTVEKGTNPFGGGASNKGDGTGRSFGPDDGPGGGTGKGDGLNGEGGGLGGGARKRLTSISNDDIQSNENCKIVFTVYINGEGNVVRADVNTKLTNTSNAALIAKVRELVKKQIKYDKRPNVSQQKTTYTVNVTAT